MREERRDLLAKLDCLLEEGGDDELLGDMIVCALLLPDLHCVCLSVLCQKTFLLFCHVLALSSPLARPAATRPHASGVVVFKFRVSSVSPWHSGLIEA
jgi:hypothetical protein